MVSFAHPSLLWFLPLVVGPVVIHLLSRLAPRKLRFPGIRFLRSSPMPLHGRRHWQDVLLMALRCLLIACMVLLASGIHWQDASVENSSGERGICALLDTSASMETAVKELHYPAFGLPEGTHYIGGATDSRDVFATAGTPSARTWEVGYGVMDTRTALGEAAQWLGDFPSSGRELHIFSDLQANDWSDGFATLPEGTEVHIHTPANPVTKNCGFTGVTVEALSQGRIRILAHFRNWGDEAVERQLTLTLDDRSQEFNVTVPPNSAGVLPIVVAQPQNAKGMLTMSPDDDYAFDDRWLFWARGEAPHPVLAVLPSEDEELSEELEAYIVPALTAEPDGAPAKYDVAVLDCLGAGYADFSDLSAIYLLGAVERMDSAVLSRVREFVESGGVLFTVPGKSPVAGWYALQSNGLAPANGTPLLEKRATGIGVIPESSPLVSLFPKNASSDLHLLNIGRWLRVETGADDTVLLQSLDDLPMLIRRSVGKGQVFLFTFGFDREASDFATSKSFLPMVRELSDQALKGHSETIRLACGDPLPARKDLSGENIQAEEAASTAKPGLWTYGNRLVEVNPPNGESIPQFVHEEELLRALSENTATAAQAAEGKKAAENQLARFLALALCGMLVLEGFFILQRRRPRITANN